MSYGIVKGKLLLDGLSATFVNVEEVVVLFLHMRDNVAGIGVDLRYSIYRHIIYYQEVYDLEDNIYLYN